MKLNICLFRKKYDELLEKYNEILEKDIELINNENYLKLKSYKGKINTNFHNYKILKEGSQRICLSVILTDSVVRTGKNYYPQVFLEEYKYVVKEKKMIDYITDNIDTSSDDSGREDSDEENSDEENFNEEN